MRHALALPWLLAGCSPSAATIDEGCRDGLPKAAVLGDEPTAFLERANCFRGYLGLAPVHPGAAVQAAVVAHRDVLDTLDAIGSRADMIEENTGEAGFTGTTAFEREVATGAIASDAVHGASSVWGWFVADASEPVDVQLDHPWLRDALFQPAVTAVGYAEGTIGDAAIAYLEVLGVVPSGIHTARPVVFPRDGDTGVPTSWSDPHAGAGDPLKREAPWGYPITITVSTTDATNDPYNPLGVAVGEASLRTDAGEAIAIEPPMVPSAVQGRLPLHTTVVIVPSAPLPPDTTFELEATITAAGASWTVSTTFSTGASATR